MIQQINNVFDVAQLAVVHTNQPTSWYVDFIGKHIYFSTKVTIDPYSTYRIEFRFKPATGKISAIAIDFDSVNRIETKDKQIIREAFYLLLVNTDRDSINTMNASLPDILYGMLGKDFYNKLFKGD